jgi:hypothetical protein
MWYLPGRTASGRCRSPATWYTVPASTPTASSVPRTAATGLLYRVDPTTGAATVDDLDGELLTNGDGLLLSGLTLYAVQNQLNTVAVLKLSVDGRSGRVVRRVTDARFDIPTTVAGYGPRLYLPNARFTTPPTPTTPYTAVAIPRP